MRWITGVLIALTVYVLAYIVARPKLGHEEPTLDWATLDIYDEIASGPAD